MSRTVLVDGVPVVHWNPREHTFARLVPWGRRRNNFGDLLGPEIVQRLVPGDVRSSRSSRRLLAVGSILHFARDSDVIWGTGRNGKISENWHRFSTLDVRAVRGPLTADFLRKRGVAVPEVFGDPGLLVPVLFPSLLGRDKRREVLILPNLHDVVSVPDKLRHLMVEPMAPWFSVLEAIAESEYVVGSSLHGKIIADALGIPAQLIRGQETESTFKYDDYFAGVGHTSSRFASNYAEALRWSPEALDVRAYWNPDDLLDAFPADLWSRDVE